MDKLDKFSVITERPHKYTLPNQNLKAGVSYFDDMDQKYIEEPLIQCFVNPDKLHLRVCFCFVKLEGM